MAILAFSHRQCLSLLYHIVGVTPNEQCTPYTGRLNNMKHETLTFKAFSYGNNNDSSHQQLETQLYLRILEYIFCKKRQMTEFQFFKIMLIKFYFLFRLPNKIELIILKLLNIIQRKYCVYATLEFLFLKKILFIHFQRERKRRRKRGREISMCGCLSCISY